MLFRAYNIHLNLTIAFLQTICNTFGLYMFYRFQSPTTYWIFTVKTCIICVHFYMCLKNYIHYFIHREQRDTTIETEIQVTNLLLFIFYFFSTIETGIGYYTFLVFITDSVDLMLNFFFIITMLAYTFHTNNTNASNQSKSPSVLVLIPLSLETTSEVCSICLNTEISESKMYKLECEHVFHMKCIKDWYIVKQSCPNCRKVL
jgi:hypothetical protein